MPHFSGSPFAKLNLWRNPFGEMTAEERAELAVVDVTYWLELLRDPQVVCQFLGPCGHGKSTHLLAIKKHWPRARYVYLPEDGPLPRIPHERPLLIDEAQRLSRWSRRRAWSRHGALVLGTHTDFTEELIHAGRVVHTHVVNEPSCERLLQIFNRRIEASRAGPGALPFISQDQVATLQRHCGADVRAMEHRLYEHFQRLAWETASWPLAISIS